VGKTGHTGSPVGKTGHTGSHETNCSDKHESGDTIPAAKTMNSV